MGLNTFSFGQSTHDAHRPFAWLEDECYTVSMNARLARVRFYLKYYSSSIRRVFGRFGGLVPYMTNYLLKYTVGVNNVGEERRQVVHGGKAKNPH